MIIEGCNDSNACNYFSLADPYVDVNTDDGSCTYVDGICETCVEGQIVDNDSDDDCIVDIRFKLIMILCCSSYWRY